MAFGQDFLKSFFGNDYVRDYTHASKIFRSNGYANSPRFKYLFHVYFNINTAQIPILGNIFSTPDVSTVGLLVKTIELPKFQLDVETLNQYNRKRLVQKKINYNPINVRFHDDGNDLIRTMWYNYYSYYYKDPSQKYNNVPNTSGTNGNSTTMPNGFDYNQRDIYSKQRISDVNDWGYIGESYTDGTNSAGGKPPFFSDITIYGFDQHSWNSYVLINPLISDWSHDTYDYSQGDGVMENSMTINYETVKYYSGAIGSTPNTTVKGFAQNNNYDQQKSYLSRPGGTRSVLGQGGLIDTGLGIIGDLQSVANGTGGLINVIGAAQKAGTAYNTFKGRDLQSIVKADARATVQGVIRATTNGTPGGLPTTGVRNVLNRPIFPTPPKG